MKGIDFLYKLIMESEKEEMKMKSENINTWNIIIKSISKDFLNFFVKNGLYKTSPNFIKNIINGKKIEVNKYYAQLKVISKNVKTEQLNILAKKLEVIKAGESVPEFKENIEKAINNLKENINNKNYKDALDMFFKHISTMSKKGLVELANKITEEYDDMNSYVDSFQWYHKWSIASHGVIYFIMKIIDKLASYFKWDMTHNIIYYLENPDQIKQEYDLEKKMILVLMYGVYTLFDVLLSGYLFNKLFRFYVVNFSPIKDNIRKNYKLQQMITTANSINLNITTGDLISTNLLKLYTPAIFNARILFYAMNNADEYAEYDKKSYTMEFIFIILCLFYMLFNTYCSIGIMFNLTTFLLKIYFKGMGKTLNNGE